MQILDKAQIGSSVLVNLKLSNDRLTKETIEAINISSKCTISDFKITDGKGIGVVLKLSNGKKQWFFENEVEILDENGNLIEQENYKQQNNELMIEVFKDLNYQPKNKIGDLLNPINFFNWLMNSVKDIF